MNPEEATHPKPVKKPRKPKVKDTPKPEDEKKVVAKKRKSGEMSMATAAVVIQPKLFVDGDVIRIDSRVKISKSTLTHFTIDSLTCADTFTGEASFLFVALKVTNKDRKFIISFMSQQEFILECNDVIGYINR